MSKLINTLRARCESLGLHKADSSGKRILLEHLARRMCLIPLATRDAFLEISLGTSGCRRTKTNFFASLALSFRGENEKGSTVENLCALCSGAPDRNRKSFEINKLSTYRGKFGEFEFFFGHHHCGFGCSG
jgi:hypothetical protein